MSFHTAAYFASIGAGANLNLAPIQDDMLIIQNAAFLPNRDFNLVYAFAAALELDRARLVNPSLRVFTLPHIRPINLALLPTTVTPIADYRRNPLKIRAVEELAMEVTSVAAIPPENVTCVIGISESFVPPGRGDIYTMRGTGATALTANAWTTVPITWADNLPAGSYAILGLESISATCIAARFILNGQELRPGVIGGATEGIQSNRMFRKGRLGEFGRFNTVALPQIQFLANAADAAETVYMDIMRVG